MNDDLLRALGREQRADLETEAGPGPGRDELDRPFDAGERADLLDAVFERVDEAPTKGSGEAPRAAEVERRAEVVQLGARRRVALIVGVLAAAAAVALVWWGGPRDRVEQGPVASVPAYSFESRGGGIAKQRSVRTDPTDAAGVTELELRSSSTIDWVLTPAEPYRGPVGLALLARSDGGETRFVPRLDVESSEPGALRLRGPLDKYIELSPGTWMLSLFVAAPDQLPSDADASDGINGQAAWRTLAVRVIVVADE